MVDPKDLIQLWSNGCNKGGQYILPIRLSLSDYVEKFGQYHTGITLLRGSKIWLHNYGEGEGSISITLQRDLKILKKEIEYSFGDDRAPIGYGFNEVHQLTNKAWENYIRPVKVKRLQPYVLWPIEKKVNGLSYRSDFSLIHNKWEIRPFNETAPRWGNKPYRNGELMEFDLELICKDFPKSGIKYLTTNADKDATHFAFRIREIISSVQILYGYMIVSYSKGEIVWEQFNNDNRSQTVLHLLRKKLKLMHEQLNKAA
jgi:hypothetical protein